MTDFPKLDECLLAWLGAGRWRVLGCRLRPLTLLHRELLRMAGSALFSGQRMLLPDLDLAVQICRRTPEAAARWLARPKRWVKLRTAWLLLCYGWRLPAQWRVLREWLEASENAPDMLSRESPGGGAVFQRDAPALLDLWTVLAAGGFSSEAVVKEWPAGLVRWIYETLATREGGTRKFETDDDRETMRRAAEMKRVTDPELCSEVEAQERARALMRALRRQPLTGGGEHGDHQQHP